MKKKLNRSLVFVFLVVFMCTFLTGCATKSTKVTNIEVTFDERTITVSSPTTNTFRLALEIEANSVTTSWSSNDLSIAAGVPHTYKLEDLVGDYISENARIASVEVKSGEVTDFVFICGLLVFVFFIIGFVLGCITV